MNVTKFLNPGATSYAPGSQPKPGMTSQVSATPTPSSDLAARVLNLENGHVDLQADVDALTELYHKLRSSVDGLELSGQSATVGPFQQQESTQAHQSALRFKQELKELTSEAHKAVDSFTNVEKSNGTTMPKASASVPPHVRGMNGTSNGAVQQKSIPPHLRAKGTNGTQERSIPTSPNNRLVTDGHVDAITAKPVPAPSSPPSSSSTVVDQDQDLAVEKLSLIPWVPHFIKTLSPLPSTVNIPAANAMVTFHPQFLSEHLAGLDWSPGLRFVPGESPCILKNRTYYLLNPATDPYLPDQVGQHGAKLTPFFNRAPEEVFDNIPVDANTYERVPMFVEYAGRYTYFGNYSQTRWSDKLDLDTMITHIPQYVKEYWAAELTSAVRPEWITQELKKHFFKKPEYEGRIYPANEAAASEEEEVKREAQMARDIKKYVAQLREWERDAEMKTALVKRQFVLDAFEAADADSPPALRLWWEYLECVEWRKDFYDLLVTLQSRESRFKE